MTKLLAKITALALLAGVSTVFAEDVQVKQRNLAYGITLREGYDSNIYTAEHGVTGSFYSTIQPDFHAAWSTPATDLTLHYTYAATYYNNRPERHWDQAHDFAFNLAHEFSPRMRVTLYDQFRPGFEPQVEDGSRQRNGDFVENRVIVSPTYNLGGRWSLPIGLQHYFIDYDQTDASESLNRQSYEGSVGLKYNVNSKTHVFTEFVQGMTSYEYINRSYTSETINFGAHHSFGPRLIIDGRVVGQMMSFDAKKDSDFNPVLQLTANYSLSSRTAFNFSFKSQYQATEVTQYLVQYTWNTSAGIVHQFTPKLMTSVNVSYIPAEYDSNLALSANDLNSTKTSYVPATTGGQESTWVSNLNIAYQFTLNLRAEIGYQYIDFKSDFADRSYSRHLTYIQARLGF